MLSLKSSRGIPIWRAMVIAPLSPSSGSCTCTWRRKPAGDGRAQDSFITRTSVEVDIKSKMTPKVVQDLFDFYAKLILSAKSDLKFWSVRCFYCFWKKSLIFTYKYSNIVIFLLWFSIWIYEIMSFKCNVFIPIYKKISIITPLITLALHYPSNMLICCSRNIYYYYYQCENSLAN